jgi:alpha-glucoside transport system permease protein
LGEIVNSFFSVNLPKFGQIAIALLGFFAILLLIFFIARKANGRKQRPIAILVFLGPAMILLLAGLIVPAIQTILFSFKDANSVKFVGLQNYSWLITDSDIHKVLFNTLLWIVITPFATTALGLFLAIMLDRMKRESVAKSLLFMPMAISFVGASVNGKFVYNFAVPGKPQTGLLSAIVRAFGFKPSNWILTQPLNTFLLMIIFVWVQTGFGMVILSAAIKAVPAEIVEASALDGASGWRLFRWITFPMVRSTAIVVLATMLVTSLKLFDIVRTMTGGNFGTSVIANEMYSEVFVRFDQGRGSALAVILFLFVAPILIYNIRNLRRERSIA